MELSGLQSTVTSYPSNGRLLARKSATPAGRQDVADQVTFLSELPPAIAAHYPVLLDHDLSSENTFYTMPFYEFPTLRALLLQSKLGASELAPHVEEVLRFLVKVQYPLHVMEAGEDYLADTYLIRARNRLLSLASRNETFHRLIHSERLIVNGDDLPSPLGLVEDALSGSRDLFQVSPTLRCMTHGQLESAHVLLNRENPGEFVLLDPKGGGSRLDPAYDFGKLRQCTHGHLDWIEEGMFDLSGPTFEKNGTAVITLQYHKPDRLVVCSELHSIIESLLSSMSLEPVLGAGVTRMAIFAEAIHLTASTPFCYGRDSLDRAVACYCSASRAFRTMGL
jgi:hypothetical protein